MLEDTLGERKSGRYIHLFHAIADLFLRTIEIPTGSGQVRTSIMQAAVIRSQIFTTRPATLRTCGPRLPFARGLVVPRSSDAAAAPLPEEPASIPAPLEEVPATQIPAATTESEAPAPGGLVGWWKTQSQKSADLRKRLTALGPAAVLAYGKYP